MWRLNYSFVGDFVLLIMGRHHPSRKTAEPPRAAAVPQREVMVQLSKLSALRAAGILADEEFNEKKAERLRRLMAGPKNQPH